MDDTFLPCGTSGESRRNLKVALTQQKMIGMLRKLRARVIRRCRIKLIDSGEVVINEFEELMSSLSI